MNLSDLYYATGSGSRHIIKDEGVALTNRKNLNFIGTNVTVVDDPANEASVVAITAPEAPVIPVYSLEVSGNTVILNKDGVAVSTVTVPYSTTAAFA